MLLETKSARAAFKAVEGGPKGRFEAIVSVFGNVDHGGDRMVPGCFIRTLNEWKSSGDPIPVIWSHDWDNPESHIGWLEDAYEDTTGEVPGLHVVGQLDVAENARAAMVSALLAQRRVREFSFGYFPVKSQLVEEAEHTWPVRELLDVDLFETGPTLLGMNPDTQLISAASLTELERAHLSGLSLPPALADRLAKALEAKADDPPKADDPASRDTPPSIDPGRVIDLLTRTRHTED